MSYKEFYKQTVLSATQREERRLFREDLARYRHEHTRLLFTIGENHINHWEGLSEAPRDRMRRQADLFIVWLEKNFDLIKDDPTAYVTKLCADLMHPRRSEYRLLVEDEVYWYDVLIAHLFLEWVENNLKDNKK